jgi:PAS domain S-box-containing protein/putative nucleotidyltransferase with HDIG domain
MMESGMSVHELVYDQNNNAVDYRFLEVNPAFERLTGLKSEQVIGHTAREVIPGIEEDWINDYIQVAQSGQSTSFDRYTEPLGRYYQVVAYQTQKDQFVTIFTDVSEQRKAEEEVRNLARFPAENPNPVIRIAESGDILYLNPVSEKLLEECEEKHSGLRDVMVSMAKQALESNVQERLDYVIGSRHFTFVITPFKESGYANFYGRDVTKQVLATQQLEHTNRVLRTLSQGNRTMIHATTEVELLQNVCDVLSNDGDYLFVWAAYSINNRLVPQVQCSVSTEQMHRWLEDIEQVALDNGTFSGLFDDSTTILLTELEHGEWTKNQVDIAREIGLSTLLLLPLRYRQEMFGVIGIFSADRDVFNESELSLLQEMAGDVAYGIESQRTHVAHGKSMERIQKSMLQTIEVVSLTLEKRDPYTAGHQQRVVQLAVAIAQELGLNEHRIEGLRLAALVHDIGKINVPAEILNRPGRLSQSEFGIIKSHPQVGYDILKGVEFDWPIADIVLQHHERCDGSGYPNGLQCEAIVLEARILAVADVVEAMTSHRPYRAGLGIDMALDEIKKGCGTIYDEDVVDTCLHLFIEKGFILDIAGNLTSS